MRQPDTDPPTDHHADYRDQPGKRQTVQANFQIGIADGFEQTDFAALQRDDPPDGQVDHKRRDPEEQRWQDIGHAAQLANFGVDESVRFLTGPIMRADPAIGLRQVINPIDDLGGAGVGAYFQAYGIESADQIKRGGRGRFSHPQNAECRMPNAECRMPCCRASAHPGQGYR